jgi:DNA-binding PadR family transcriptional regulator
MKDLTLYESIILLAILRLKDNAYGVTIREKIEGIAQRSISYGTLYSYLDQIHRKGYVSKSIGKPLSERGGRRKIFYKLTPDGAEALKAAYKLQKVIWAEMPK